MVSAVASEASAATAIGGFGEALSIILHHKHYYSKGYNTVRAIKLVVVFISLALLGGCGIPYYISDAPGCTRWIGANIGGCSGVTVIDNLKIEPVITCLTVEANNCNGGMIEIWNSCEKTLVIGDLVYPPHNDLDVIQDAEGNWIAVESDGNFVRQIPEQDIPITLAGRLGDQEVTLSFTKSAPLCDAR